MPGPKKRPRSAARAIVRPWPIPLLHPATSPRPPRRSGPSSPTCPGWGSGRPRTPAANGSRAPTGPALGAVFKGNNKNGFRRWSTTVTVVACEPGKVFEFAVTSGPLEVANWRYEFEDTESGLPGHRVVGGPAQAVVRHRRPRHGRPQRGTPSRRWRRRWPTWPRPSSSRRRRVGQPGSALQPPHHVRRRPRSSPGPPRPTQPLAPPPAGAPRRRCRRT